MNGCFRTRDIDAAIGLICYTYRELSSYISAGIKQAKLLQHEFVDYYHVYLGILCDLSDDVSVKNAALGQKSKFFSSAMKELVAPGPVEFGGIDASVNFVRFLYSAKADSRILGSAHVTSAHLLCHILAQPNSIINHIYAHYLSADPRSIIESVTVALPDELGQIFSSYYLGLYDLNHKVYSMWHPPTPPTA